MFIPKIGEDEAILTNIFSNGLGSTTDLQNDLHNLRCERSLHGSENISGGHEKTHPSILRQESNNANVSPFSVPLGDCLGS